MLRYTIPLRQGNLFLGNSKAISRKQNLKLHPNIPPKHQNCKDDFLIKRCWRYGGVSLIACGAVVNKIPRRRRREAVAMGLAYSVVSDEEYLEAAAASAGPHTTSAEPAGGTSMA